MIAIFNMKNHCLYLKHLLTFGIIIVFFHIKCYAFYNFYNRFESQFSNKNNTNNFNILPLKIDSNISLLKSYDDSISLGTFLMHTMLSSQKDSLYQLYHTKFQNFYFKYQLPIDILFIGRKISWENRLLSFEFQPLTHNFNINPVEGFKTNNKLMLTKEFINSSKLSLGLDTRYGFNSGTLASNLKVMYSTRTPYYKSIEFGIGTQINQFNNENPVAENINSLYYLLDNMNYLKIYYQKFIKTGYTFELKNGLKIQTKFYYEYREPLSNLTRYPIIGYTTRILPNYPTEILNQQFTEHAGALLKIQLKWQINSHYESIGSKQYLVENKLPTLILNFTQAIPKLFKSVLNFNKWDLQAIHKQNFNQFGTLNVHLIVGGFINTHHVEIMDYNHYYTNQFILNSYKIASFQALPIYLFSNKNDFYLTSFNQYQIKGLFNKTSIKKWDIFVTLNANFLYINSTKYYHEYKIGLEHLFKYFTLEFVYGLDQNNNNYSGIRLLSNFF
ncbi:MAG: DUF5686 family protein [Alphaproteobacteria bacterium]|nr:DUF5686 family protein [Alphaproteobacteria bacterium]